MEDNTKLLARDVMARELITLKPDQPIDQAVALLLEKRISGAPVVDDAGALIGILSEKDCLALLANAAMHNSPSGAEVANFMTREVKTIPEEMDLITVASTFIANPFRRLPVLDADGNLVGQVSRRDVLRGIQRLRAK